MPSRDDDDEFRRAMTDVTPVTADPRGRARARPRVTTPPPSQATGDAGRGATIDAAADADYTAPGVDRRTLRQLKRGGIPPGDHLDLHGQTAAEAAARVTRFIDVNRPRHRCVCIVHGRGLHSEGNVAILRTRVRALLRAHRGVLAYADAPRTGGGSGAVYVLLRK